MADVNTLWDFEDVPGSEARFRAALVDADDAWAGTLSTQLARALGSQERFEEAHALLDAVDTSDPEVAVRAELERGRLLRTAGDPDAAAPHFERAAERAAAGGLDALAVDAIHMQALVAEPEDQLALGERALRIARASADPRAQAWDASLLNNIGMTHADAGDFAAALAAFEEALAARRRLGDDARTRVARWMVAWALRNLGRREEALAMQRDLKREFESVGEQDEYVDEEIALLTAEPSGES